MYEDQIICPKQIVEYALSLSMEYKAVHDSHKQNMQATCSWLPPPNEIIKLNIDVAIFAN